MSQKKSHKIFPCGALSKKKHTENVYDVIYSRRHTQGEMFAKFHSWSHTYKPCIWLFYYIFIKKGKRGTVYLDFLKIWISKVFDDFWQKSRFTLFLLGAKKYCVWTLCSINGFQLTPCLRCTQEGVLFYSEYFSVSPPKVSYLKHHKYEWCSL